MKKMFRKLACSLRCAIPSAFLLVAVGCCRFDESTLTEQFASRRSVLDEIAIMMQQDRELSHVSERYTQLIDDFTWPRPPDRLGITAARWDRYRELLREVRAEGGATHQEKCIRITINACGLGISGLSEGYLFALVPPGTEAASLGGADTRVVHLEGPWYLFFEK